MSRVEPGSIRAQLPSSPPDEPEGFEAVLADLDRVVVPGLSHWQHPRFFGYFPSNGELSSVLGDYLSTGLGVLGLSWQSSPALTEIEEATTDWVRQMIGLSDAWSGVIQDTASSCTLVALVCARERASGYSLARGGLQAEEPAARRLRVRPQPQLGGQGGAPRRLRARERPRGRDRRRARDAARRARRGDPHRPRRRPEAVRRRRHDRHHDHDRPRPRGRPRGGGPPPRPLAARGRRPRRLGHDPARVPLALGRDRGGRLARLQPPQVAGRRLRLLALLRPRPAAPRAGDEHEPELPAQRRRREGQEPARLGHPPRPPVPGAQAVVPHPRAGRLRSPGPPPPGHREREVAGGRGREGARTGACSPRFRCRRSASATSRPAWRARPSTGTPSPGPSASTARAPPTSPRRRSTGAGWCASASAPSPPSARTSRPVGGDAREAEATSRP